ncbi:hypothetical protein ACVISU_000439 [Bradyrhizobium sp. USDA 4452]
MELHGAGGDIVRSAHRRPRRIADRLNLFVMDRSNTLASACAPRWGRFFRQDIRRPSKERVHSCVRRIETAPTGGRQPECGFSSSSRGGGRCDGRKRRFDVRSFRWFLADKRSSEKSGNYIGARSESCDALARAPATFGGQGGGCRGPLCGWFNANRLANKRLPALKDQRNRSDDDGAKTQQDDAHADECFGSPAKGRLSYVGPGTVSGKVQFVPVARSSNRLSVNPIALLRGIDVLAVRVAFRRAVAIKGRAARTAHQ